MDIDEKTISNLTKVVRELLDDKFSILIKELGNADDNKMKADIAVGCAIIELQTATLTIQAFLEKHPEYREELDISGLAGL